MRRKDGRDRRGRDEVMCTARRRDGVEVLLRRNIVPVSSRTGKEREERVSWWH
jgi:hypothetical protein